MECQKKSYQTETNYSHQSSGQCLWSLWVLTINLQQHITRKEMVRLNKQTKWLNNTCNITSTISRMIGLITYPQHSLHLTTQNIQLHKKHHSLWITDTIHSFVIYHNDKINPFQKMQKRKLKQWKIYACNYHKILTSWICEVQSITTDTKERDLPLKGGRKHSCSAEISKWNDQVRNSTIRRSDHSQLKRKLDK